MLYWLHGSAYLGKQCSYQVDKYTAKNQHLFQTQNVIFVLPTAWDQNQVFYLSLFSLLAQMSVFPFINLENQDLTR